MTDFIKTTAGHACKVAAKLKVVWKTADHCSATWAVDINGRVVARKELGVWEVAEFYYDMDVSDVVA